MKVKFEMIYGGKVLIEKKDKDTKKPTGEVSYMTKLIEVNNEKNVVEIVSFFNKQDIDTSGCELLKPCVATIEMSASSDFKTLLDIKPIK